MISNLFVLKKTVLGFLKWTQIGFPKDGCFSATPVIHS